MNVGDHKGLMMKTVNENLKPLINRAVLAILAAYAVTTIHHIFGGVVDSAENRLLIPGILAPLIMIAVVSLYLLRRNGNAAPLITFAIVALVWVLLLGLLHGGYAHLYKDIVFLVDAPPSLYYSLNPSEHYPPDNAFFEVTGVLDVVGAAFVAYTAARLIHVWRQVASGLQRQAQAV
jgi:hypothetical protein